jgi:hypothetical protein
MGRDMVRRKAWQVQWAAGRRDIINAQAGRRRDQMRAFLLQQKMGKACVRCGNDDYRVLDFHHREPDSKVDGVAKAIKRNWSRAMIMEEIAKCDVLCANCHRIQQWELRQATSKAV